jgi:hypothetical protein
MGIDRMGTNENVSCQHGPLSVSDAKATRPSASWTKQGRTGQVSDKGVTEKACNLAGI